MGCITCKPSVLPFKTTESEGCKTKDGPMVVPIHPTDAILQILVWQGVNFRTRRRKGSRQTSKTVGLSSGCFGLVSVATRGAQKNVLDKALTYSIETLSDTISVMPTDALRERAILLCQLLTGWELPSELGNRQRIGSEICELGGSDDLLKTELYLQLVKRTRRPSAVGPIWELFAMVVQELKCTEELKEFVQDYLASTGFAEFVPVSARRSALAIYDELAHGNEGSGVKGYFERPAEFRSCEEAYLSARFPISEEDHVRLVSLMLQSKYGHVIFANEKTVEETISSCAASKILEHKPLHWRAMKVYNYVRETGPCSKIEAERDFISGVRALPYRHCPCVEATKIGEEPCSSIEKIPWAKSLYLVLNKGKLQIFQKEDGLPVDSFVLDDIVQFGENGPKIVIAVTGDVRCQEFIFKTVSEDTASFLRALAAKKDVTNMESRQSSSESLRLRTSSLSTATIFQTPGGGASSSFISEINFNHLRKAESVEELKEGDLFAGKYVIKGRVPDNPNMKYASHIIGNRRFVLKFYIEDMGYENTIQHLKILSGDFVCKAEDFIPGSEKYPPCLVFERGEKTLKQWMSDKSQSLFARIGVLYRILECLSHVHERGIIHGDIKPNNIVRFSDESWKIIDFDGAVDSSTEVIGIDHTVAYAAPEAVGNSRGAPIKPLSTAIDMWSFGIISYEMLCGGVRFYGDEATEDMIIFRVLSRTPLNNHLDIRNLEARKFLDSLLREDPKNRLSAAEAMKSKIFDHVLHFPCESTGFECSSCPRAVGIRSSVGGAILRREIDVRLVLEEIYPSNNSGIPFHRREGQKSRIFIDRQLVDTPTYIIKNDVDYRIKLLIRRNSFFNSNCGRIGWSQAGFEGCDASLLDIFSACHNEMEEVSIFLGARVFFQNRRTEATGNMETAGMKSYCLNLVVGVEENAPSLPDFQIRVKMFCKMADAERSDMYEGISGDIHILFHPELVTETHAFGVLSIQYSSYLEGLPS